MRSGACNENPAGFPRLLQKVSNHLQWSAMLSESGGGAGDDDAADDAEGRGG